MKKRKATQMQGGVMYAVIGILIMVALVNYAGFIVTARMHLESATVAHEALRQIESLAFHKTVKNK